MRPIFGSAIAVLGGVVMAATLAIGDGRASIVSGVVTGRAVVLNNGGTFIKLTPPIGDFGTPPTGSYDDFHVRGFDEVQNYVLTAPLSVDTNFDLIVDTVIPTGTLISSHYIHFDPQTNVTAEGNIEFSGTILGIIADEDDVSASNFLSDPSANFLGLDLGLEGGDSWSLNSPTNLEFGLNASQPGDSFRVITVGSVSPVPLPAPFFLFMSALAGLGLFGWWRRQVLFA